MPCNKRRVYVPSTFPSSLYLTLSPGIQQALCLLAQLFRATVEVKGANPVQGWIFFRLFFASITAMIFFGILIRKQALCARAVMIILKTGKARINFLFHQLNVLDTFSVNALQVGIFMYSYHNNWLLPRSFENTTDSQTHLLDPLSPTGPMPVRPSPRNSQYIISGPKLWNNRTQHKTQQELKQHSSRKYVIQIQY